jgi:hypothetical protein
MARPTSSTAVSHEVERAGLRIDLDFADMSAIGKAELLDGLVGGGGKRPAQILGHGRVAVGGGRCDVENPDRAVGAFDGEAAGGECDIVLGSFQ